MIVGLLHQKSLHPLQEHFVGAAVGADFAYGTTVVVVVDWMHTSHLEVLVLVLHQIDRMMAAAAGGAGAAMVVLVMMVVQGQGQC